MLKREKYLSKIHGKAKYIRVCYRLDNEKTIDRESGAFDELTDKEGKYVISLDKIDYSRGDIKHINIFDFLMNDDF